MCMSGMEYWRCIPLSAGKRSAPYLNACFEVGFLVGHHPIPELEMSESSCATSSSNLLLRLSHNASFKNKPNSQQCLKKSVSESLASR
jgi:hypothetical protein